MPQDQQTGAEGNKFGRDMAPKIALGIGATMVRRGSNEATLNGKRIVIKCANVTTASVGVSYKMLPTLDSVIAAFRRKDGEFDLFSLSAKSYAQHMSNTRSKGSSKDRVGIVIKKVFETEGERV